MRRVTVEGSTTFPRERDQPVHMPAGGALTIRTAA
jgi:hypothetical protein